MRELPTVSRDRLLDALCVVERDERAVMLPDVARAAAESLPGVSLAFLVTGTARGVAPLRAAASRLPGRRRGHRGAVRPRGRGRGAHAWPASRVFSIGYLEDLRAMLARSASVA